MHKPRLVISRSIYAEDPGISHRGRRVQCMTVDRTPAMTTATVSATVAPSAATKHVYSIGAALLPAAITDVMNINTYRRSLHWYP